MPDISSIDKNFVVETNIERENIKFYNVNEAPFKVYGIKHDGERFRRMPKEAGDAVSAGVGYLAMNTAGGRVRFVTDSPYIILKAKLPKLEKMGHMALTGSSGFDLYVREDGRENYKKTFVPLFDNPVYDGVIDFSEKKSRLVTINFPLYNCVNEVYIGLHEAASVSQAPDYTVPSPMVFYGSSITQGGCASRPGTSYQAYISRRYDADYINLGFSGSAKGECEMREYIKNLDMSAFVLDYDYNAPTNDHLRETHKPMYEAVRAAHPSIPIIIMPRPSYFIPRGVALRCEIVKDTYDFAVASGDENVYYINADELMALAGDNGTVDGCHPTDLGFFSMAEAVIKVLDKIFEVKSK